MIGSTVDAAVLRQNLVRLGWRAEPWWPLLGGPRAPDQIAVRVRQIHEVLGTVPVGGNVILVTHFVTVQDATGERPRRASW